MNVFVNESIALSDDHVMKATCGATNRSAIHSDSKNPTETTLLQENIKHFIENNHDGLNDFFKRLVSDFSTSLILENTIFFRGVTEETRKYLTSKVIGPSPNSQDGRYNKQGEDCLYLIDSKKFIFDELKTKSILVQEYSIPINKFKIADLSSNNGSMHNSLALAFQMTESGRTSAGYDFEDLLKQQGKTKYLVSQLLAKHFKNLNWDGMYIPGIHGSPNDHYCNLVLFGSATKKWRQMTVGEYYKQIQK